MDEANLIAQLPPLLATIRGEVNSLPHASSNLDTLAPMWAEYVAQAKAQIPALHVESEGELLYTGELSPGCRACKDGTWDCVFTTMQCKVNCEFCCSPQTLPQDFCGSAFGATRAQITENYTRTRITGISFSGGEPFTQKQMLVDWIAYFKNRYPKKYYWIYTNGLLADEAILMRLGQLGVDEIRFNVAATGYNHPSVMRNLASAARYIPNVTIEIPAIPEHADRIMEGLVRWCKLGVKFLNLHELLYEPGTNSATLSGSRCAVVLPDGHRTDFNPASRWLTLAVMSQAQSNHLPLSVNDCSLQSKLRQLRGRRQSLAPLVRASYEKPVRDAFYECCCAYRDETDLHFFHPDTSARRRAAYADYAIVRLVRTAPLSLSDRGRWVVYEEI